MERSRRIAVFLQVRINSCRLPGKAVMKIYRDITTAGCAMMQLKKVKADCHVLLTDSKSYDILKKEADLFGFSIFKGSEDDVLNRFASASRFYKADTVIRATGDNPFVFPEKAASILKIHIQSASDHSLYKGMPLGGGVEVVEAEALYTAEKCSSEKYDREHVTPYIYNHPEIFTLNHKDSDRDSYYPEGRITLDTENDYNYLKKAASDLTLENACSYKRLIEWLKVNPHPDAG